MGKARVRMRVGAGAEIQTEVYMIEGKEESLLGQEDAEALGIVTIRTEGGPGPGPARETMREMETEQGSPTQEGSNMIDRTRRNKGQEENRPDNCPERRGEPERDRKREGPTRMPRSEGGTGNIRDKPDPRMNTEET